MTNVEYYSSFLTQTIWVVFKVGTCETALYKCQFQKSFIK